MNPAVRVMHFTKQTPLKITPFELNYRNKSIPEIPNIVEDGEFFLYVWSEMAISVPSVPKISIYVGLGRNAEGEITKHMIMEWTKTEAEQLREGLKSPKQKFLLFC